MKSSPADHGVSYTHRPRQVLIFPTEHVLLRSADSMGKRVVYFSDLTNQTFANDQDLKRIVVVWHPDLENGPVELGVSENEVESICSSALRVVSLKLPQAMAHQRAIRSCICRAD